MANFNIIFNCSSRDGSCIETYLTNDNQIGVSIYDKEDVVGIVFLDKPTAIKFAKTLRTEINKIDDGRE